MTDRLPAVPDYFRAIRVVLALYLILIFSAGANAQEGGVTIDLVKDSVDITAGFSGAYLPIYGTSTQPGEIAIIVSGPDVEMVVRHKEEVFGIWMNKGSVRFDKVPAYYDLALSVPAEDLAPPDMRDRLDIGLNALRFVHTGREDAAMVKSYREALIRNKQTQGYFPLEPEEIQFIKGNFFKTGFYLPPDVPTGTYTIRSYLFQDGKIADRHIERLKVAQVGFGARLHYFAYVHSWAYGLLAVILGILAGWLAHAVLRKK